MGKYNVHAGHAPAGGTGCGAVSILNESTEARKVKNNLITFLKNAKHTVYDCTCNTNMSASKVLSKIVSLCNAHTVDIDVSIHLNSGRNDLKGDDSTGGVEVLIYNEELKKEAKCVADEIAKTFGYRLRSDSTTPKGYAGVKIRTDLYVLRNTKAKAMLIECCFVDDKDDAEVWDAKKCAKAIFKGLTGQAVKEETKNEGTAASTKIDSAKSFNAELAGTYTVNASDGYLTMRAGANTSKTVVTKVKTGEKVRCYGYYTKESDGTTWLLVKYGNYTGFMAKGYLKINK